MKIFFHVVCTCIFAVCPFSPPSACQEFGGACSKCSLGLLADAFAFAKEMTEASTPNAFFTTSRSRLNTIVALGQKIEGWKPDPELDEEAAATLECWATHVFERVSSKIKGYMTDLKAKGDVFCKTALEKATIAMAKWSGGMEGQKWKHALADNATWQEVLSKSETLLHEQTAGTVMEHFLKLQKEPCDFA